MLWDKCARRVMRGLSGGASVLRPLLEVSGEDHPCARSEPVSFQPALVDRVGNSPPRDACDLMGLGNAQRWHKTTLDLIADSRKMGKCRYLVVGLVLSGQSCVQLDADDVHIRA